MKNDELFKKAVFVLCLIVALLFLGRLSAQKTGTGPALPPAIKFKAFQSANPPFNFMFEYPDTWRVRERSYKGDYDMVEVMGITDKNSPVMPGAFITKRSLAAGGSTLKGLMDAWLQTESRYKGFKVLSSGDTEIAGQKALKTEYTYTLSLPLWNSGAKSVTMKKEQTIMARGGESFEITFLGTDEQFKIYGPVFQRVLKSLKFL